MIDFLQFIFTWLFVILVAAHLSHDKSFWSHFTVLTMLVILLFTYGKPLPSEAHRSSPHGAGLIQESIKLPSQPPQDLRGKSRFWAATYRIDPALFAALIEQESRWQIDAVSPAGARGLGQVMPFNAPGCGITQNDLFDPDKNLQCSGKILKEALVYWDQRFPNDADSAIRHALGEYNAGRNAVIHRNALTDFRETKQYVQNIMGNYVPTPGLVSNV